MKWRRDSAKGGEGTLRFKLLRTVRLCDITWEIIIEEDDTMGKDPAASL